MMGRVIAWVAVVSLVLSGTMLSGRVALGQEVIVYSPVYGDAYSPVMQPMVSPPVLTYAPPPAPVIYNQPMTVYRPIVPPAPAVVYRPLMQPAAPPPVYAQPIYPAPVVTYRPPLFDLFPAPAGQPVVVQQKVYVPGQPIRNLLRAFTP